MIKGISLQVRQGDFVRIIGKNGSGKSIFFKILFRVTAPTGGSKNQRESGGHAGSRHRVSPGSYRAGKHISKQSYPGNDDP